MNTMRAAIAAAIQKRADDTDRLDAARRARSARTPDMNNPWSPPAARAERRTSRPYRDPTGEQAIGNLNRKKKP